MVLLVHGYVLWRNFIIRYHLQSFNLNHSISTSKAEVIHLTIFVFANVSGPKFTWSPCHAASFSSHLHRAPSSSVLHQPLLCRQLQNLPTKNQRTSPSATKFFAWSQLAIIIPPARKSVVCRPSSPPRLAYLSPCCPKTRAIWGLTVCYYFDFVQPSCILPKPQSQLERASHPQFPASAFRTPENNT